LDIPFLFFSGTMSEEEVIKAIKAGAGDCVQKGNPERLIPAIERELREAWSRRSSRHALDALRRSQQELSDFFEHAAIGMHWQGPEGTILRVNEAELQLLGYNRAEYLGRFIAEFHADPGVAQDVLRRLHSGETLNNYEARVRCQDGSFKHVLLSANVYREDGRFIHSRCFMRDISHRKLAEEAMSYLAALVESSEDAVIGKSLDGKILTWNSGAERIYGYTADEVRGRSVTMLYSPEHPDDSLLLYDKIKNGERIERLDKVRVRKDGQLIDISLTLSPIKNAKGEVIGVSAIERDITARKKQEAERVKLIKDLREALTKIKTLRGLLPICASCKKIRDDRGYWQKVESYISQHTEAEFTHGICPECRTKLYPEYDTKAWEEKK
jgi:PAS domain S-box-containing protein